MKKIIEGISVFLFFCLMFTGGYLAGRQGGWVGKKREIQLFMRLNNLRNISKNIAGADLDEEDARFISEHVWGQWRISARILEINCADNISSRGIEEMKSLVFIYDEDYAMISGYDENTFSEEEDIFLYLSYGGDQKVNFPVYHVDRHVDEDNLLLSYGTQGKYCQFPEDARLVHVTYNLGYDTSLYSSVLNGGNYAASDIYVNPDNKDILYVDMCGLWKLERVKEDEWKRNKRQKMRASEEQD
ncbi:MAG: hypothetical protein NC489_27865 [Ruminococcus flavefaciens]|nr:hypothetical protein [Ruminococcus flavefaciens]